MNDELTKTIIEYLPTAKDSIRLGILETLVEYNMADLSVNLEMAHYTAYGEIVVYIKFLSFITAKIIGSWESLNDFCLFIIDEILYYLDENWWMYV